MKRKENVYRSPDIQNEIVKVMGIKLLRNLSCDLQHSPFLAIWWMRRQTSQIRSRQLLSFAMLKILQCMKNFSGFILYPQLILMLLLA